jgi:hypothetical protein
MIRAVWAGQCNMRTAVLAGAAFSIAACANPMAMKSSAPEPMVSLEQACARSVCRTEAKPMRLRTPEGTTITLMTERFPYADGGRVSIFPGETFVVEFDDARRVNQPRFVSLTDKIDDKPGITLAPTGSKPTMSFELKQDADGPSMMLVTKSTLDAIVKFDATMYVPTGDGMRSEHTSTCPVIAGGGSFETWPFPIGMLVLSNFRVLPKDTKNFTCE